MYILEQSSGHKDNTRYRAVFRLKESDGAESNPHRRKPIRYIPRIAYTLSYLNKYNL